MQKLKTFGIYIFCFMPEILMFLPIFIICNLINYNKLGCIIMGVVYVIVFAALYPFSKDMVQMYLAKGKQKQTETNLFSYNPTLLELKTPCPICGKEEVVWENVAENGYISEWGDDIICKPRMQFPCPNCESQIEFDIGIEKEVLDKWIENNLKFLEKKG